MAIGKKTGFFAKLREGLSKTASGMAEKIEDAVLMRPTIDEDLLDDLEEALILSDIGMETTMKITDRLREDIKKERLQPKQIFRRIEEIVTDIIVTGSEGSSTDYDTFPMIILMIGVNGAGKTTTIAKLSHMFKEDGKTVMVAAADTFRAAAIEQMEVWCDRVGVPIVKHQEGSDPSAVIFDAIQSAKAKKIDVLICDTAGRLQNKRNLMNELEKMAKVIDREYPEAVRETLLVVDAATGKNAISQAKEFSGISNITGMVLTKLDGTAKGGIVITITDEFSIPVKFIGVGEGMDDLQAFDPEAFAKALFNRDHDEKVNVKPIYPEKTEEESEKTDESASSPEKSEDDIDIVDIAMALEEMTSEILGAASEDEETMTVTVFEPESEEEPEEVEVIEEAEAEEEVEVVEEAEAEEEPEVVEEAEAEEEPEVIEETEPEEEPEAVEEAEAEEGPEAVEEAEAEEEPEAVEEEDAEEEPEAVEEAEPEEEPEAVEEIEATEEETEAEPEEKKKGFFSRLFGRK